MGAVAIEPESDVLVLEDFEDDNVGEAPADWKARAFEDGDAIPYEVVEEGGNRFLRAEARGENVMLYKETRWNADDYPFISWRWRIRAVPEGADARSEDTADNAAGLYLSYRRKFGIVPETVKFIWSERLEPGASFRRPGMGQAWTVVAGRGVADDDTWHQVFYNVGDVYAATFGARSVTRPLGIGVLTDANSTGSFAAADYDDVVVMRRLPEGIRLSRVEEKIDLSN